jgi:hypothetical protein
MCTVHLYYLILKYLYNGSPFLQETEMCAQAIIHIRITDLLKTAGLPALNQMAIQSLATMTWDAFHSHDGRDHDRNGLGKTIFDTRNDNDVADVSNSNPVTMTTRSKTSGEVAISLKNNCLAYNAVKLWNVCPTLRAAASKPEAKCIAVKLAREAPP